MTALSSDLRDALAKVGTSTLTGVLNRRGLRSMTLYDVWPLRPEQPRMVGIAFTMRFIPSREDKDGPTSKNRSTVQPQAMEECPPGHVLMINSRGNSRAASAGDLYVGRLKARGAAGIVTDGGFRDTDGVFKTGLPAYHRRPSSPPSPIAHRPVDLNLPIACGGVAVYPGDIVVGDRDAILVIPPISSRRSPRRRSTPITTRSSPRPRSRAAVRSKACSRWRARRPSATTRRGRNAAARADQPSVVLISSPPFRVRVTGVRSAISAMRFF